MFIDCTYSVSAVLLFSCNATAIFRVAVPGSAPAGAAFTSAVPKPLVAVETQT